MIPLRWIPRFLYGPDYTQFTLTYPVTRWHPGGRSTGRAAYTGTHQPGHVVTLQKRTLALNLRFTEDEWWAHVRDFLLWVQRGYPFQWFHGDYETVDGPISYAVIAEFPRVSDPITPSRDGSLLWMMAAPLSLSRMDGEGWDRDYMTLPLVLPEDATLPVPDHYTVTVGDAILVPGGTTLVTIQLVDMDEAPIARAGHFLVLSLTGAGGSLSETSGVTDEDGRLIVTLTAGEYLEVHIVSVVDEDGRGGMSEDIDVTTGGVTYAVTSNVYENFTTLPVTLSAQLKDGTGANVHEAGHVVTWAKTAGIDGAFAAPTSLTNALGKAAVVFTFGEDDTNYTITATDEFATTGVSPMIHSLDEGLGFLRSISQLEFAVDVAACAILSGGGALIDLEDHSGKDVDIALGVGGGGHDPVYEAAGWAITGGTMPRLVFDHDLQNWFLFDLPTLPQPFSLVLVFDGFAVAGAGQHNAVNFGGAVSYYNAAWSEYAGNIANSAFLNSDVANQGKLIRIDVFNGAASHIYRGSTASGLLNPGAGGSAAGFASVGARFDGVDAATMKLAAIAIFSKVLSGPEMTDIIAGFAARYPGLGTS